VLDPFCGSGSSLVAARDAGCRYIGIELDADHHRTASKRLGVLPEILPDSGDIMPWLRPFTRYVDARPLSRLLRVAAHARSSSASNR
jgi:hypothetical protein